MRSRRSTRRPYRFRAWRDRPVWASGWTLDVDLVDLMLDLDPGMLDHNWLEDPPGSVQ
ncbi:MAG: hypothetical protein ABWY62_01985 [Acidimicrobiia bacterium]